MYSDLTAGIPIPSMAVTALSPSALSPVSGPLFLAMAYLTPVVFISDQGNCLISSVQLSALPLTGSQTVLAGSTLTYCSTSQAIDGHGTAATFAKPAHIVVTSDTAWVSGKLVGNLYVLDLRQRTHPPSARSLAAFGIQPGPPTKKARLPSGCSNSNNYNNYDEDPELEMAIALSLEASPSPSPLAALQQPPTTHQPRPLRAATQTTHHPLHHDIFDLSDPENANLLAAVHRYNQHANNIATALVAKRNASGTSSNTSNSTSSTHTPVPLPSLQPRQHPTPNNTPPESPPLQLPSIASLLALAPPSVDGRGEFRPPGPEGCDMGHASAAQRTARAGWITAWGMDNPDSVCVARASNFAPTVLLEQSLRGEQHWQATHQPRRGRGSRGGRGGVGRGGGRGSRGGGGGGGGDGAVLFNLDNIEEYIPPLLEH